MTRARKKTKGSPHPTPSGPVRSVTERGREGEGEGEKKRGRYPNPNPNPNPRSEVSYGGVHNDWESTINGVLRSLAFQFFSFYGKFYCRNTNLLFLQRCLLQATSLLGGDGGRLADVRNATRASETAAERLAESERQAEERGDQNEVSHHAVSLAKMPVASF